MVLPLYESIDKNIDLHMELTQRGSFMTDRAELEEAIAQEAESICNEPACIQDFASILPWQSDREKEMRRYAWMCQHIFSSRAIGVNIKIHLSSSAKSPSPIASQISKQAGLPIDNAIIKQHVSNFDTQSKSTIACLLFNKKSGVVDLVEAMPFSTAKSVSGDLMRGVSNAPLWQTSNPFYSNIRALPQNIEGLLNARTLLEDLFPNLRVRAWVVICNNPEDYTQFQCHDLTSAARRGASGPPRDLDEFEKRVSSLKFKKELNRDDQHFLRLPINNDYWLNRAPNDRSMRCYSMLNDCNIRQERLTHFVWFESSEIASWFEMNYQLTSLKNQHRHDLEDNLHKHRFMVGRRVGGQTRYGIGPKGLVRLLIAKNKFSTDTQLDGSQIVAKMLYHESLWLKELNKH